MLSADPALEAFLPTSVVGRTLQRFSVEGSAIPSGGTDVCIVVCPGEPDRFAAALGVPIDDITIAAAVTEPLAVAAVAYRARGVRSDRLIPARRAIGGAGGGSWPGSLTELRIAGKAVSFVWFNIAWDNGEYLIAKDDVLVIVFGPGPAEDGSVPAYIESEIAAVPR